MNNGGTHSPARRARARVFISYRRRFDQSSARDLQGRLVAALGREAVFRDANDIAPGENFEQVIRDAIKSCDTLLALISPGWLDAAASLHGPKDFVRLEIAGALREGLRVIPVLIGGAQMPREADLPEDMRALASRQAEELSDRRWDEDVGRLIEAIRPPRAFFSKLAGAARTWPGVAALAALLLCAGYAAWRAASAPASVEQCFRRFLPEKRWSEVELLDPAWRNVLRQDRAGRETVGVVLTEDRRRLAAVKLTFTPSGRDGAGTDTGFFRVEGVVGADCARVEDYWNYTTGERKGLLGNYDYLMIRAGGREYFLRVGYNNHAIQAQPHPKPPAG